MEKGQGATTALPIWAYFFQRVISDSLQLKEVDITRKFERPDIPFNIELNCNDYESSTKNANELGNEYE